MTRQYMIRMFNLPNESWQGGDGDRTGIPPVVLPENERIVQVFEGGAILHSCAGYLFYGLIERIVPGPGEPLRAGFRSAPDGRFWKGDPHDGGYRS